MRTTGDESGSCWAVAPAREGSAARHLLPRGTPVPPMTSAPIPAAVPAQRPMLRATSCAAVLLRFGLFISLPSQCPLQTARLVGEEPARHDTVWQLTVVETPVVCMKPLPLNRTPSPRRVVPSSARPSYSAPLATSVGVARLMDSSPTWAQNGFTFYRCAACQPQSRVEPAARAAPRPGKARRKGNYIHQLPPWRAAVLRSAGEFCGRTPGRAARAQ